MEKIFIFETLIKTILIALNMWFEKCNCRLKTSDGSESKSFDPGWVGSIFCGSGWVRHLWFGFDFGKFPLKMSNFSIFPFRSKKSLWVGSKYTRVKGRLASYLLQVKSKFGWGQGPSLLKTKFKSLHFRLLRVACRGYTVLQSLSMN